MFKVECGEAEDWGDWFWEDGYATCGYPEFFP